MAFFKKLSKYELKFFKKLNKNGKIGTKNQDHFPKTAKNFQTYDKNFLKSEQMFQQVQVSNIFQNWDLKIQKLRDILIFRF